MGLSSNLTASDLDVTISNLPKKLGFSKEFQEELQRVGGSSQSLAVRLLESHDTENLGFKAGQLCATPEQLNFYTKILDAGPMVTRWLTTGYEIPFSKVPAAPMSARNNKSCKVNIEFARAELKKQVSMGSRDLRKGYFIPSSQPSSYHGTSV